MLTPVTVANKSWWVPSSSSPELVTEARLGQTYQSAMLDKLESLVKKEGLKTALAQARAYLPGLETSGMEVPRDLAHSLLEHPAVQVLLNRLSAEVPAPADQAEEVVSRVSEGNLASFLSAVPVATES